MGSKNLVKRAEEIKWKLSKVNQKEFLILEKKFWHLIGQNLASGRGQPSETDHFIKRSPNQILPKMWVPALPTDSPATSASTSLPPSSNISAGKQNSRTSRQEQKVL